MPNIVQKEGALPITIAKTSKALFGVIQYCTEKPYPKEGVMNLITPTEVPHVFVCIPQNLSPFEAAAQIAENESVKGKWIILYGNGSVAHQVAEALRHIALTTRSHGPAKDKKLTNDGKVFLFKHGIPEGVAAVDGHAAFVHVHLQRTRRFESGTRLGSVRYS